YTAGGVSLQVVSNGNTTAEITGSVVDTNSLAVTNLIIMAFTTNSGRSLFLSTVTDGNGNYVLNVTNGVWSVGVQDAVVRGYNTPPTQQVTVSNANEVANFV